MFLYDAHVRVERVVLEDHRDVAVLGLQRADGAVVEIDLARAQGLEAGEDAQRRGLAAAGRADEDRELAIRQIEIERKQHTGRIEALFDLVEHDARHAKPPFAFIVIANSVA